MGTRVRKNRSLIRMFSQESRTDSLDTYASVFGSIDESSQGLDSEKLESELKNAGIQGVDSKLLRELGEDNVDQAIIGEEIAQLSEEYDLHAITWRQRMVHFLHTIPVEIFMIFLVLVDVLIILGMVVLDMYIVKEELELVNKKGQELLVFFNQTWPDLAPGILQQQSIYGAYKIMVEFKKAGNLSLGDADDIHSRHKRASGGAPHSEDYGTEHSYNAAKMIHNSTNANHILHYCSIAILAVFVVEVGLKIIGYGKNYFRNKWEVIDGVVILISFALDIAVTNQNFSYEVGKTVLVVFLMWRVIRILNAMVLTSRARTMFRLRVLRKSKRIAEDRNKQLSTQVGDQQTEINKLRHIARMYGADTTEIVSAQVLSKTTPSATKTGLKHMMASIIHLNTKIATVSCTSLNKTGLGPQYNRARRPSMIGDETMCHDKNIKTQSSLDDYSVPMRQRAASDAGGLTKLTHKLRTNLADLKNRRRGSTQLNGSSPNVGYDSPDHRRNRSASLSPSPSIKQGLTTLTIKSETENDGGHDTKSTLSSAMRPKVKVDKNVGLLHRNDSGFDSPLTPPETKGMANGAFRDDDCASEESAASNSSGDDSGYDPVNKPCPPDTKDIVTDKNQELSAPKNTLHSPQVQSSNVLDASSPSSDPRPPPLLVPQISITIHDDPDNPREFQ